LIVSIDVKIRRQTIKRLKHIVLLSLLVIGSIVLVACSLKIDNGTYVYEPSKEDIKIIIEEQGKNTEGFDKAEKIFSLKLSIKIAND